ncbi:hypothetical protein SBRCBS47491_009956 [Sporothrix bragantina]|uniref:C6 zinc finger domain containing protein n=1 Tax=Sporothrix bragantina TaxID=671064 RepID=A0ABP0D2P1_9PEZI
MQTSTPYRYDHYQPSRLESSTSSLNQRRGHSDLARFSIDLTWARAESEEAIRAKAYPSPPMSGSPPLPPKPSHEAGERSHGSYQTSHDVYQRTAITTPPHGVDMRVHSRAPAFQPYALPHHQPPSFSHSAQSSMSRPYPAESHDRHPQPYASYGRPEDHQFSSSTGHMPPYPPSTHLPGPPAMTGCDAQRPCSRFIERGSASDANVYPPPLSVSTRALEPAAFLTTDLEMAKASNTFLDAIGRHSIKGLNLLDLISPMERERVVSLQRQMLDERDRKDPQYLPPIFAKRDEERVIQSLGLSADDLSRYAMDWHEYLTFNSIDGQQRTFPVRLGLAKQDSIYFIVLGLHVAMRPFGHMAAAPSPHSRDMSYAYQPMQQHAPSQHQMYSQPTPVSAPYDAGRPRMPSDSGILPHRPTASGGPSPMLSGVSPSISSAYGPSPGRSEYSTGPPSYQTPRSELTSGPLPNRQPQQTPSGSSYQLPPIRNHQEPRHMDSPTSSRDDKSRVDIGGLLDNPEPPRRMH